MLECNQTITLIKCDGEAYTGQVFDGVSWYDKTKVRVEGAGLVFANATSIRIPAAAIAPTALLPKVGDQVIHGRLPLDFTVSAPLTSPRTAPARWWLWEITGAADCRIWW